MYTKTCRHCGKTFQTEHRPGWYCAETRCYSASENVKSKKRYQRYSPARRKAILAVSRSLQNGSLVPQPCELCGTLPVVAHHDDYAAPLEVRWLCISHHRLHHIKHGPGKNAFSIQGETP